MTFMEAMKAAHDAPETTIRVFRPNGPELRVSDLGMVWDESGMLYLGDILDLDDWKVEEATE